MKTLQYLPPNKQWFNPKDWVDYKTFDMSVPDVDIFKMVLDHPDTYVTTFDGVKHYANDTIKTYKWGPVVECDVMYKS